MKIILKLAALAIDSISWLYPFFLAALASFSIACFAKFLPITSLTTLLLALPFLYLLWLFLLISISALATTLIFLGFEKPRRLKVDLNFDSPEHLRKFIDVTRILLTYRMGLFMERLPVLNYSLLPPLIFRWMNVIVLRAYAPSVHIGPGALVISRSQDPDLTHIGKNVVIGAGCNIVCHALNTFENTFEYASEVVQIDDGATIGGSSRLGLGVKVGQGAVVEVGSNVLPYTRIAPYEVWGGNPARFIRQAKTAPAQALPDVEPQSSLPTVDRHAPASARSLELDGIIAKALRIPLEQVTDQLSSDSCADWDSLAKMAIAAAIFDRFGLRMPPEDIAQLTSKSAIQAFLDASPDAGDAGPPADAEALPSNPELLPLGDFAQTTRLLAQAIGQPEVKAGKTIRIAATFTAQPLISALELWCRAYHLNVVVEFLGFNQVEEALLSSSSLFHSNADGLNCVLVRPEDLITEADPRGTFRSQQILDAVRRYTQKRSGLIVSNLPPIVSAFFQGSTTRAIALRSRWQSELEKIEGVYTLDFAGVIEDLGRQQARDTSVEVVTRAPYSQQVYQQLGIAIARLVRQIYLPPKKVIALDCDNTLWGGVVGEEGLDRLTLSDDYPGRSFRLFQSALLALKKLGVLLVVVSKNEADDVWQVFDHHPEMLLKRTDLAGARINWSAKSANLRELASELNLGLDAFVFIDDSPNEQLEVATNAPEVTVIPLPSDPTRYVEALTKLWCFDTHSVTAEDNKRTEYMLQEQQRQKLQTKEPDLEQYLKALQIEVDIRLATETELARVAQLTQKTNQFNLSLVRRSLTEVKALSDAYSIWVINVQDRFGDYGLVGVAIVKPDGDQLLLDTFLISCRALGRGVETAFLAQIFDVARKAQLAEVIAPYAIGPRNSQVRDFLVKVGFQSSDSERLVAPVEKVALAPSYIKVRVSP